MKSIIVKKFGGSSLETTEKIQKIAELIKQDLANNPKLIIVVSAMSGVTNQLSGYCSEISELISSENLSAYDGVVTSGEQISSNLMALALQNLGIKSRAFQGWQVPIYTDELYGKAKITSIDKAKLEEFIDSGGVPVVSGFGGITEEGRITSLGRGGSDTTAMALAVSFEASQCQIFTDVEGIYSANPAEVDEASKLEVVTHEEMLELSKMGAKVLNSRAAFLSMKYNIDTSIFSTFSENSGTKITSANKDLENNYITGIARNDEIALINIYSVPSSKANLKLFKALSDENIKLDLIIKSSILEAGAGNNNSNEIEKKEKYNLTLTIPKSELAVAKLTLESLLRQNLFKNFDYNREVSLISIVGAGMNSHSGIALRLFRVLEDNSIEPGPISTSEVKISLVIDKKHATTAVKALHTELGLDKA